MSEKGNKTLIVGIIIVTVVIAVFILFAPNRTDGKIWGFEKEAKQKAGFPAMVIKCEYKSIDKKDFLKDNEFEATDSLKRIYFYVLDSIADIEIEFIEIMSPGENSGETYFVGELAENLLYPNGFYVRHISADGPIHLDEVGQWRIQLSLNEDAAVYRYDGPGYSISDKDVVEFLEDDITTIQVLSFMEVQQIESDSDESPFTIPVIIAIIGIPFTIIVGIITVKRYIHERRKERKPSILSVIVHAIDEDVARELDWLNNITIEGLEDNRFRDVPDFVTENILNEARWKNFEDEYKETYSDLKEYVELKNRYAEEYEQLNESIKSAINDLRNRNPDINNQIQQIMVDRKVGKGITVDIYYQDGFEWPFVRAIIENENPTSPGGARSLFTQFEVDLRNIRDNPEIQGHIEALQGYLNELKEASALLGDIKENKRERLRRKYNILREEINNYNIENIAN